MPSAWRRKWKTTRRRTSGVIAIKIAGSNVMSVRTNRMVQGVESDACRRAFRSAREVSAAGLQFFRRRQMASTAPVSARETPQGIDAGRSGSQACRGIDSIECGCPNGCTTDMPSPDKTIRNFCPSTPTKARDCRGVSATLSRISTRAGLVLGGRSFGAPSAGSRNSASCPAKLHGRFLVSFSSLAFQSTYLASLLNEGPDSQASRVMRTARCVSTTSNSLQANRTSPAARGTSSP